MCLVPAARAPRAAFQQPQLFSLLPSAFMRLLSSPSSPPLSTSCAGSCPAASPGTQRHAIQARLAFIRACADENYGVNRSISGETGGRWHVNRQDGLREAEGTKEKKRGGEEEGRGHLIEMEIEQAN